MNIPKSESSSLFPLDAGVLTNPAVVSHLAADLLIAGSYVLLLYLIVDLNARKYVTIYLPRQAYLISFSFLLIFGLATTSLTVAMPALPVLLGFKLVVAFALVIVAIGIWRIIPRGIDEHEQYRLQRENIALQNALNDKAAVESRLSSAIDDIESKVEHRTSELSQVNLALEKEVIERRFSEERAQEAKRRLDELIMRTNTALVVIDRDGSVSECNHALAQILGRASVEEIYGRKLSRMLGLKDERAMSHFIDETLRHGTFAQEFEAAPPTRGPVGIEANAVASVLDGGPKVMALFRDITERRSAEREILQSREALTAALDVARQANATRSDFLAKMNHELRTPLNGIIGLSEILRHKSSGKMIQAGDVKKLAGNIHQSGTHLLSVVDDLLDLSRLDAGNRQLSPTRVAVRAEIDAAILTLVTIAEKKLIVIRNHCHPELEWSVDQRAFKQIIINLVNNAVKFSPLGSAINIEVTRSTEALSVHIRDEGPGVAEEDKARILEPFGRGEYAKSNKIDGVGLGLTIVSELLKLQGGRLSLESELGLGSTFTAIFPVGTETPVEKLARQT